MGQASRVVAVEGEEEEGAEGAVAAPVEGAAESTDSEARPCAASSGEGRRPAGAPGDALRLLIVGLGNPGSEFDGSRHNAGADAVALLARRHGVDRLRARRG